jgi:hypothetical protein
MYHCLSWCGNRSRIFHFGAILLCSFCTRYPYYVSSRMATIVLIHLQVFSSRLEDSKPPAARGKRRTLDEKWMDMFQKLVAYKEQHKNIMVPQHYDENPQLGSWANRIPAIRVFAVRITLIFTNKKHALNTLKMGLLLS